jgi:hypothetical protein
MAGLNPLEYINSLACNGNIAALDELSKIANGGNVEARKMIRQIEASNIVFRDEESPKIPKRSDLVQIIFHPIESLRTKARQILVCSDRDEAPVGSNQEDFPNLGIAEAAALLRKRKETSGVPFEAWPKSDQERMKQGQKPKGCPIHSNV